MKKIIFIAAMAVAATAVCSCDNGFDEMNQDPNNMVVGSVSPVSLLPDVIYTGAAGLTSQTYNLTNELIQYSVGTNTSDAYHRFVIPNGIASNAWNLCARWAAGADHIVNLAGDQAEMANFKAIGITMRSFYMQILTDTFGDVPFAEAFQGMNGNVKPSFYKQRDVYMRLINDLEEANTLYNTNYPFTDAQKAKDVLYSGDITSWRKFTNSLLMRVLIRVSNCDDSEMNVSGRLKAMLADPATYPVFTGENDAAVMRFTGVDPNKNTLGNMTKVTFESSRRAGEALIDVMRDTEDPRLPLYCVQVGGEWIGCVSGEATREDTGAATGAKFNKSILGEYASPYSFMNYDEILFILAEAAQKGLIDGGEAAAEDYYKKAITASIRHWSSMPANKTQVTDEQIETFLMAIPYDGTLKCIMQQKYVALFWIAFEAWAEYRRTGYPELRVSPSTMNDHILPRRLPYPVNTGATNPENYAVAVERLHNQYKGEDDMKTPVWWSQYRIEKNY